MLENLPYLLMLFPIITIHEFAHAWMAHRCGDDTAKDLGRMNLNPMSHIELFGSVILPIINLSLGGTPLGFGKTVPVDRYQFQHPRRDDILVALAGPVANLLLAFIALAIATFTLPPGHELLTLAGKFASFSVFLGFFNLLPFPPMDGWTLCKAIFKISDAFE
ncbi:MAG: site-2 protease family protein, partial [Verrucomicrobiota bacterium]